MSVGIIELEIGALDLSAAVIRCPDGHRIALTKREIQVLGYLTQHEGEVVTRSALLLNIWGYPAEVESRAADSAIQRLRKKLEVDPAHPRHLITHHGLGFRWISTPATATETKPARSFGPPLLGREGDVAEIRRLLRGQGGLVLVHGPPGVGKSSLARAVARDFDGVVLVCACGPRPTTSGVMRSLAVQLGFVGMTLSESKLDAWIGAALSRASSVLLLLDDAERGIPALWPYLSGWLRGKPGLHVLATSRQTFPDLNASRYALSGLSPDPGADLLRRHGGPDVRAFDKARLVEVAARYDGNPMILIHIAGRARSLGAAILARVNSRGASTSAVLAKSWDMLPERSARTLRCVSVFPTSFSMEAAQFVTPFSAANVRNALESLTEASLLYADDVGGYRVSQMVREDAAQRLRGSSEVVETHAKHLIWALRGLERPYEMTLTGDQQAMARFSERDGHIVCLADGLAQRRPHLVARARLARDGWLRAMGNVTEAVNNAAALAEISTQLSVQEQLQSALMSGRAAALSEDFECGRALLRRVIDDAERAGFDSIAVHGMLALGSSMTDRYPDQALVLLQRARVLAEAKELGAVCREIYVRTGNAALGSGKLALCIELVRTALPQLALNGERLLALRCHALLAIALSRQGDFEASILSCNRAVESAMALGLSQRAANALAIRGGVELELGCIQLAIHTLNTAVSMLERVGQHVHAASAKASCALAELDRGDVPRAEMLLLDSLPSLKAAAWYPNYGAGMASLGLTFLVAGRPKEAVAALDTAIENFGQADAVGAWTIGVHYAYARWCVDPDEQFLQDLRELDEQNRRDQLGADVALVWTYIRHIEGTLGIDDELQEPIPPVRTVDGRIVHRWLTR